MIIYKQCWKEFCLAFSQSAASLIDDTWVLSCEVQRENEDYKSQRTTKPTKWHVCPAKTQISLGIRPVWSESLLSAWRKLRSLATHWAQSGDSDQTRQIPRLIWVFAGRTWHFVVLSNVGSKHNVNLLNLVKSLKLLTEFNFLFSKMYWPMLLVLSTLHLSTGRLDLCFLHYLSSNVRKRTVWHGRQTEIQISFCIRAVLSEFRCSSESNLHPWLSTMRSVEILRSLIWVFDGRTCQ